MRLTPSTSTPASAGDSAPLSEPVRVTPPWTPRRCILAAVGLLFVVLGAIGIMVPGIPGFVFLLLASWCFAKSFPALERKILRNRFFAPYMRFMDGDAPLPRRDKLSAITLMWISTCVSIALLWWWEAVPVYMLPVIAAAAGVGTVVILRRGERR